MSLYDQVGGPAAVRTAVTVFYNRVLEDAELAPWFENIDVGRLKAHQRAFLAAALDGPQAFTGRDLVTAHAGRAITDEAFDGIVGHLVTALADLDVDARAIELVGQRLELLRPQIVLVPASDDSAAR